MRLSAEERKVCAEVIRKLSGSSEKARRASILLQVDAAGPDWTDRPVAEALGCRVQTVENVRRRCVLEGFEAALHGRVRPPPELAAKAAGWSAGSRPDRLAAE